VLREVAVDAPSTAVAEVAAAVDGSASMAVALKGWAMGSDAWREEWGLIELFQPAGGESCGWPRNAA